MNKYISITSDKSKKQALKLCAWGGIFGIHDFYLGKYIRGIIKLFTFNFFFIGWIRDLIKIASGGYKDNANAYLRK